jgi:ribonuclease HII
MTPAPRRVSPRRSASPYSYDRALDRLGLGPVAGVDEAGRGACAGPLVVAAVVLPLARGREVAELADSKLLTPATRERVYDRVVARASSVAVVVVEAADVDRGGVHRANLEAMRRAVARLDVPAGYVLTDGFPVAGIAPAGLGVWKGDRVSACVAAASVVAKVTRDRLMVAMDSCWPEYGFAAHKGYSTEEHMRALERLGPCPQHRRSYVNVARAALGSEPEQYWEDAG